MCVCAKRTAFSHVGLVAAEQISAAADQVPAAGPVAPAAAIPWARSKDSDAPSITQLSTTMWATYPLCEVYVPADGLLGIATVLVSDRTPNAVTVGRRCMVNRYRSHRTLESRRCSAR